MSDTKSIVIVHFDERGEQNYFVGGDESVRLFIVDERAPGDRVYEWLSRDDAETIKNLLGDDPIGSSNDERHKPIKHVIERMIDGRPRLELVPAGKD